MNEQDNGVPAFPGSFEAGQTGDYCVSYTSGMSLRDYFAAKAMQGYCAANLYSLEKTAKIAYAQADAMLEARKK